MFDIDEYNELTQHIENYEAIGLANLLPFEQSDYKEKKQRLTNASFRVETLPELRYVMEQLIPSEETIIKILCHENDHAIIAETLGVHHTGYGVVIFQNGQVYEKKITFPKHLTQEEINIISKEILQAPEMYSKGKMSNNNKADLLQTNNRILAKEL